MSGHPTRRAGISPAAAARLVLAAALLVVVALVAYPLQAAQAAPAASDEIPEITDRYASIDELANSRNSDQRVIIDTNVSVLTSVNRALNGLQVRFSGEAVGDVLAADAGHKWVNVLGSSGATIGVYMSDEQATQVANLGDYHTSGTVLEIEGDYSMACTEHQGELDIHATSVKVLDAGGKTTRYADENQLVIALGLCVAGFAFLALFIFLRRRWDIRSLDKESRI